jgi:uncharacterized protein (TIGR03437 family)
MKRRFVLLLIALGCLLAAGLGELTFAQEATDANSESTTEMLALDDGTPEGALGPGGLIYVNRLTPSRYPAKLQALRIYFRKFDNLPSPSGSQLRLIAFAGAAGAAQPPANPRLLLDQSVTIPDIAASGEFVDFLLLDGPAISSGDLYVGFELPVPLGGVGAWFDLNSKHQARSFSSANRGAFWFGPLAPQQSNITSANLMVRAIISLSNGTERTVATVSAASFDGAALASEAIAAAFGERLATTTAVAPSVPGCPTCLPTELAGTIVKVKDSAGIERPASLFFVSPGQINYLMPKAMATGRATVTVTSGDGTVSVGTVKIAAVAPGLFTANGDGRGAPAAVALRFKTNVPPSYEPITQFDATQRRFIPRPLELGGANEEVFLVLFGTGVRNRQALSTVSTKIGGIEAPVLAAGPQVLAGLDQLNVRLPRNLSGRGEVDVVLTVDGKAANTVRINIK